MSIYLQPADYTNFGVPNTALPSQVQEASALIDSFLQRPEGLIYTVDSSGNPAAMENTGLPLTENIAIPINGRKLAFTRVQVAAVLTMYGYTKGFPRLVTIPVVSETVESVPGEFSLPSGGGYYLQGNDVYLTRGLWQLYDEIQATYVPGYTYSTMPTAIKQACANIVNEKLMYPEMSGEITQVKVGDGAVTRKSTSSMSSDTKLLLAPWVRTY